jgi:hypothetical protein
MNKRKWQGPSPVRSRLEEQISDLYPCVDALQRPTQDLLGGFRLQALGYRCNIFGTRNVNSCGGR